MKFKHPLVEATLLKRKHYLAEAIVEHANRCTISCPNFGPMLGLDALGTNIWLSKNNTEDPHPYTWEIAEVDGGYLVDINTYRSSGLLVEAIGTGKIEEFKGYVVDKQTDNYFVDLTLVNCVNDKLYLNVENVSYADELNRGFFPMQISCDGYEQLRSLIRAKKDGFRAVLFFCIQNTGINKLYIVEHIDKKYAELFKLAVQNGVEVVAYKSEVTLEQVSLQHKCPIVLAGEVLGTT